MKRTAVLLCVALAQVSLAQAGTMTIVSLSDNPDNADAQHGRAPDVDGSGDRVAYASSSNQLDDTLHAYINLNPPQSLALWPFHGDQIFLHDIFAGTQTLISRDQSAMTIAADGHCFSPRIDPTGRYVVFLSAARNLTADPASGVAEVFRFDATTGAMLRFSNTFIGTNSDPDVAETGAVVYARTAGQLALGDFNFDTDIYLARTTASAALQLISRSVLGMAGNGTSRNPAISGDGGTVVYESTASNLVPGDTNGANDVFLYDVVSSTTLRLSDAPGVDQALMDAFDPDVSADGRYVVFSSEATNLVTGDSWTGPAQIFLFDRATLRLLRISAGMNPTFGVHTPLKPRISANGSYVIFEAQGPVGRRHLLRYQIATRALDLVQSLDTGSAGTAALTHAIGDDGRSIVFDNEIAPTGTGAVVPAAYQLRLAPGSLQFSGTGYAANEFDGAIHIPVERTGGSDGSVSVRVSFEPDVGDGAAIAPYDYTRPPAAAGYVLTWPAGDTTPREVVVRILDDLRREQQETFRLHLSDASGGAVIGSINRALIGIHDDD